MERLLTFTNQALGLEARQNTTADFIADRNPRADPALTDIAAAPNAVSTAKTRPSHLLSYFAVPVILLLLAHYIAVMKWDLDTAYLRPFTIAVPLACGFLSLRDLRLGIGAATLLGLSIALAAVAGMMTVVGLIDQHAILPRSEAGWQEAVEYVITITLATAAGNLLARLAELEEARPLEAVLGQVLCVNSLRLGSSDSTCVNSRIWTGALSIADPLRIWPTPTSRASGMENAHDRPLPARANLIVIFWPPAPPLKTRSRTRLPLMKVQTRS